MRSVRFDCFDDDIHVVDWMIQLRFSRGGDCVVRLEQPLRGAVAQREISRGGHLLLRNGGKI